jgi:hypothetical protein
MDFARDLCYLILHDHPQKRRCRGSASCMIANIVYIDEQDKQDF